jgi:hypothetical protein
LFSVISQNNISCAYENEPKRERETVMYRRKKMRTRENHDSMVLIFIFKSQHGGGDEEYKTQCRNFVSSHFLAERVFTKKYSVKMKSLVIFSIFLLLSVVAGGM